MEITRLKLSELEPNAGQIPGLPTNPRQWTKTDVDKLARSLKETPELFEARPIIAFPYGGKYVILGGNMRYEASKVNKAEAVPVVVFPAATSIDKLKEVVIKDNGAFGNWDWDMLANEWDVPFDDWGVPAWDLKAADGLPEELNGVDLTPDDLAPVEGAGEDGMKRVIIAYTDDEEAEVLAWLGLETFTKIIYDFKEVKHDTE